MGAKHTPGPWTFLEDDDAEDRSLYTAFTIYGGEDDLAEVFHADQATVKTTRDQAMANARLIAVAPDFYRQSELTIGALVLLRMAIAAGDPAAELYDRIQILVAEHNALIAKAEGGQ